LCSLARSQDAILSKQALKDREREEVEMILAYQAKQVRSTP
jgi:hypothetical protein